MEILILGAGVMGLTCARELLRRGHAVRVWTRDEPLATTSAVAAALWYPFEAQPLARISAWGVRAWHGFRKLADVPETGVRFVPCDDLFGAPAEPPPWADAIPGFERRTAFPEGSGFRDGWSFPAPVIETPLYLPWLVSEVEGRGGVIEHVEVTDLAETNDFPVVVACVGLGARELFDDAECFPIRGQIARVGREGVAASAFERALVFQRSADDFGYLVPRSSDAVLGGTTEHGVASLEVDAATTGRILARCAGVVPELARAEVREARVGLRPGRTQVRLETEALADGRHVVHNHGHGGCGVTLSLACAEDVADLVEDIAS